MNILSFSNFLCFMFTGIYSLKVNIESKLNQFAFFICMTLGIWSFSYTFFYVAESKEEAWFWHKLGSIGWCSFASFIGVSLYSHVTNINDLLRKADKAMYIDKSSKN